MIQLVSIEKSFGEREIFSRASLNINSGERVALFGRNGSGKSTLLRIIAGEESADSGEVSTPKGYRIGYLKQHLSFSQESVLAEAAAALSDPVCEQYKAEIVLAGLGFSEEQLELHPSALSGGFQIRINLAKLVLSEPNLLLLDEPTNYLDIVSLRWLEGYLKEWPGEMIVISHDRFFCDQVSTHSCLVYRGGLRKLEGDSQKLFERIAQDEELYERTRENREREIKRMQAFITRFKAKASKATLVQSRVKALSKIEQLDELSSEATLDFSFVHAPFPGRFPLEVKDLNFRFDTSRPPIIDRLSLAIKRDDRIGVIGKNGRGKSTLLKLFAGELSPSGGEIVISPNTSSSFFAQTNTNRLNLANTIEQEVQQTNEKLSRTAVRSICGCMMFEGDDALKRISVLSGGERSRVLLGKILATPTNLLLLDEPTNHLDVESVLALTDALEEFDGAVVIVTHSEEILRRVARRLIVFQGDVPFVFEGGYDEFLDSIGWDGEEAGGPRGVGGKRARRGGGSSRGDREAGGKRARAEYVQERSRALNPAREKVTVLEGEVARLEGVITKLEGEVAQAAQGGEGRVIEGLSVELAQARGELERVMQEWEGAEQERLRLEERYRG
jgi:ATP-binding cassette subfamily F protein 3